MSAKFIFSSVLFPALCCDGNISYKREGEPRHKIVFSVVRFTHVSCQPRLDFLITVRRSETDGNEQARECVLFKKNVEHRHRKAPLALYMPRTLTTRTVPEKTDTGAEKTGPEKTDTGTEKTGTEKTYTWPEKTDTVPEKIDTGPVKTGPEKTDTGPGKTGPEKRDSPRENRK